ncbi:MAG: hypothetical protein ACREVE_16615 [Gammaproteobacteria bacterium]
MQRSCLFVAVLCCLGAAQAQEDPQDSCGGILKLYEQGEVDAALEEARWCVEALEQVQMSKQSAAFPAEVAGWKRQSLDQNKAMGMALTEAGYNKGEQTISVSLMGGGDGGGGFLSSLAQMGMMSGGAKMRLGEYTGVAMSESGGTTVSVSLKNGGTLSFQSYQASSDALKEFATAFPIGALDGVRE